MYDNRAHASAAQPNMCRLCRARGLGKSGGGLPFAIVGGDALSSEPCQVSEEGGGGVSRWSGGGADAAAHAEAVHTAVKAADVSFGSDEDVGRRGAVHRVVVGAGVAGTCCAEELCRLRPHDQVTLITAADVVKVASLSLHAKKDKQNFTSHTHTPSCSHPSLLPPPPHPFSPFLTSPPPHLHSRRLLRRQSVDNVERITRNIEVFDGTSDKPQRSPTPQLSHDPIPRPSVLP